MTPVQARRDGNQLMVSFNIWDKAKRNRTYPKLVIGSQVRVMTTRDNKTKGTYPKLSVTTYKVTYLQGQYYTIGLHGGKPKLYRRHELQMIRITL